jgi:tRNA pseudouridine55 synthase
MNGIINVYKEAGWTSNDVVSKLKGIVGQRKIGHTGTLDPDAEGVLPVCLGKATRLCASLTDEKKTYKAVLLLGVSTDTQDVSGTVLKRSDPSGITQDAIRKAASSFLGKQMQVPPMYSALKKDGKRLYELARAGVTIEREPRPVEFFSITILKIELPRVTFSVTCSKGTYIRTLCHDLGEKLGAGGCMEQLTRTRVGRFRLEDAIRIGDLQKLRDRDKLTRAVLPIDEYYAGLPGLLADAEADHLLWNGNPVGAETLHPVETGGKKLAQTKAKTEREEAPETGDLSAIQSSEAARTAPEEEDLIRKLRNEGAVRVYDSRDSFIGIFRPEAGGHRYRPLQMYFDPQESEKKE